jgi:hypothetical protein
MVAVGGAVIVAAVAVADARWRRAATSPLLQVEEVDPHTTGESVWRADPARVRS